MGTTEDIDTSNQLEVVILVVGNERRDSVADALAPSSDHEWGDRQRTAAGVRIFARTSPKRVVVDTTPLPLIERRSPCATATQWVSQNSLRRAVPGRPLLVVCVVNWSAAKKWCSNIVDSQLCWMDIFRLIFKQNDAVLVVVNTEGDTVDKAMESRVANFLMEHELATNNAITYANLNSEDESLRIRTAVERIVSLGKMKTNSKLLSPLRRLERALGCLNCRSGKSRLSDSPQSISVTPVTNSALPVFRGAVSSEGFEPWRSERVIVIGKTGSGKSTLAQMLTLGHLDPDSKPFTTSSGIKGGTHEVESGEGRGWYVVDTPGFGEFEKEEDFCTISSREAQKQIYRYVKLLEGTFCHYLYVVKKDRIDMLEQRIWNFFVYLFGVEIGYSFSVVVSGADNLWLRQNIEHLRNTFQGCESFLCAEFPPLAIGDEEWEAEYQDVRIKSLREFEEGLAERRRSDMTCNIGQKSRKHLQLETRRAITDSSLEKNSRCRIVLEAAHIYFAADRAFSVLAGLMSKDDGGDHLPPI